MRSRKNNNKSLHWLEVGGKSRANVQKGWGNPGAERGGGMEGPGERVGGAQTRTKIRQGLCEI